MRRVIIRAVSIILAIILLLPVVLIGFLQTDWSRRLMISLVESYSPKVINGTVTIGRLTGSLIRDLKIENLMLRHNGDTVVWVNEIAVSYHLMPLLIGQVAVDSVRISDGKLFVVTDSVNGLNLSHLLLPSDQKDSAEASSIDLFINRIIVDSFRVSLLGFASPTPTMVDNVRIFSQLKISGDELWFALDSMSAQPNQSWPELRRLSFNFHQSSKGMALTGFRISTLQNQFLADANYASDSLFDGNVALQRPSAKEFDFLLPDVSVATLDTFYFKADNQHGRLIFDGGVEKKDQKIQLQGHVDSFRDLFSDSLVSTPFQLSVALYRVRPNEWMPTLPSGVILNGLVTAQGERLSLTDSPVLLDGNLNGSSWQRIKTERLQLNASVTQQKVLAEVDLRWAQQSFRGKLRLNDWLKSPRFDGFVRFAEVDLARWPGAQPIRLGQGEIHFRGNGTDLMTLNAEAKVRISPLMIYDLAADSLQLRGHIQKGVAAIDTMTLAMNGISISAAGNYDIKNERLDGHLKAVMAGFNLVHSRVAVPVGIEDGLLLAQVKGALLHPQIVAELKGRGVMVDSMVVEQIQANANGEWTNGGLVMNMQGRLDQLQYDNYRGNEVQIHGRYSTQQVDVAIQSILQDSIRFNLATQIFPDDTTSVKISHIALGTEQIGVENPDTIRLRWSGSTLWVDHFDLSQRQQPDSKLSVKGVVDPMGDSDLTLDVKHFKVTSIQPVVAFQLPEASVSAELHLSGRPNAHRIDINTQIDSMLYNRIAVHQIVQKGVLSNRSLNLETRILNQAGEYLPILLHSRHWFRQDSLSFAMVEKPRLTLESQAENILLQKIVPSTKTYQVSDGLLSFQMVLSGDMTNPSADGYVRISGASFKVPSAGADFNRFDMGLRAQGSKLLLDSLKIRSGKGMLDMSGDLSFESGIVSAVQSFDMSLKAKDFRFNRSNYFDFTFDADASVATVNQAPVFRGRVDVDHARINMDKLMYQSQPEQNREQGLLVTALNESKRKQMEELPDETETVLAPRTSLLQLSAVKGRLTLVIPRNTWLMGDNMGIELMGNLDVVKEGVDFELFGNVGVNRGFYTLYGRKLNIVKGDLIFQGGTSIDPTLSLQAQYVFRTVDRQKKTLEAIVGGTLTEPEITFELDGESVTQGDAVGYLVFGKPLSELGVSNQQAVGQVSAGNAVSGMLTSELTKLLGKGLNLDVLEIDASENWESASFVVGKYLTNNLFVIYQRAFGKSSDNEIAPESVTLEYELNRHLFFRIESGEEKTSGADIILKIESKKQ